jgi:myo-inositol 2-dehydrogenase/D-chiro-inositol 1-dehydrogenase
VGVRVAMLGVGRLGAFHATVLAGRPEVEELRVHDADANRTRSIAAAAGARAAARLEDALDGADAVVIATPTGTHAALINACLDRGLPVFCEKPIALDLASTRGVVDRVAREGGRVQIGFQRRFDTGFRRARELVREGALGTVYGFAMTSRDALPPPDAYVATSGGQFRDQLIHDFDQCRWLFGDEVDEVVAMGSTLGFDSYRAFGDVATSAVLLRLRGGAVGTASAARHNEAGYDIRVDIYGARETIAVGLDQRTPIRSVEQDAPALGGPRCANFFERFGDAYRAELAHFLRYARGEEEDPVCTAADALEALRIAEAADRSLHERRPVRLEEIA